VSEENKSLVRRLYEAINQNSLEMLDEITSPEATIHTPFSQHQASRGRFEEVFTSMMRAFPDYHVSIEEQIAEADKVVTCYTARGTQQGELMGLSPTGKEVSVTGIDIDRVSGGNIVEHWSKADTLGMMQQLGAVPEGRSAKGT
jgi:predicted ester cyclase